MILWDFPHVWKGTYIGQKTPQKYSFFLNCTSGKAKFIVQLKKKHGEIRFAKTWKRMPLFNSVLRAALTAQLLRAAVYINQSSANKWILPFHLIQLPQSAMHCPKRCMRGRRKGRHSGGDLSRDDLLFLLSILEGELQVTLLSVKALQTTFAFYFGPLTQKLAWIAVWWLMKQSRDAEEKGDVALWCLSH